MGTLFNVLDTDDRQISIILLANDSKSVSAYFDKSTHTLLGEGLDLCAEICDGVLPKRKEVAKYQFRFIRDTDPPFEGMLYCQIAHNQSDSKYLSVYEDVNTKELILHEIFDLDSYGFYALLLWLKEQKLVKFKKYPRLRQLLQRVAT
ncbi:hypothetical protein IJG91_02125 [Candidatus Saccharibacteria bacterium]|nr:hypothetical protein [Candidatus Saccharibacteria bacterium]